MLGAAGGVGLAAVTLGKLMGARVIAAASTDEKLALCRRYGADETINYTSQPLRDRLNELVGKKGVDVIYDPVGGDLAEPALRSMAWGGRYLVVGFAAGPIPSLPFNLPLLKGCSVVGVSGELSPNGNQKIMGRTCRSCFSSGSRPTCTSYSRHLPAGAGHRGAQ